MKYFAQKMKTTTTLFLSFSLSLMGFTNNNYHQAMQAALNQFSTAKNITDLQSTANSFNRISNNADQEWLPNYYKAHCYILMSFMEKNGTQKDAFLDIAEEAIHKVLKVQPENSEAYALQAFMFTGRLVVDPMTRGREYSILSNTALKKSLAINPTNPRALYLQLTNEIGTAGFFGTDTSVYCERIEALNTNWDKYNKTKGMEPSWGKDQANGLKSNCK